MNEEMIKAQLLIAERNGLIEPEDIDKYMEALRLGAGQEATRSFSIGKSQDQYIYDRINMSEDDVEDIEGYDDIERNIVSRGILTKDDFYKGFSVQLYQAAQNNQVIIFPKDLDFMAESSKSLEESEKATKAGYMGEDYRRMVAERFKRAVYTYDWKQVAETFGLENAGSGKSMLNKTHIPNKFYDKIDSEIESLKPKTEVPKKNYANSFLQFLDKGIEKPVELWRTGDYTFKIGRTNEEIHKTLQAFGLSKFEPYPVKAISNRLTEMATKEGIVTRAKVLEYLEEKTGTPASSFGFQIYNNPEMDKAIEYGERNFSGFSAAKGKAVGINIRPVITNE